MANILNDVFGAKPGVAKPRYVDLGVEQGKAAGENISNFPTISRLGDLYSTYLQGAIEKQLPGYSQILRTGASDTQTTLNQAGQLLKGEIPDDVKAQIERSDAFQSLLSGTEGSDMARSLTARDLGLTSLDLIGKGAALEAEGGNSAQLWSKVAGSTIYDPARDFVTPAQQAAITANNNLLRQNYQQMMFNVAAAPDPAAKGISDTIMSLVQAYIGHGMGGGNTGSGPPANTWWSGSSIPANTSEPWQENAMSGGGNVWGGAGDPQSTSDPFGDSLGGW